MKRRRAVISGMGVVSSVGIGVPLFADAIIAGHSGARLIDTFDVTHLPTRFAAPVPLTDTQLTDLLTDKKMSKTLSRSGRMALVSTQEALMDAGLGGPWVDATRVGTSIGAGGTGLWDTEHSENLLAVFLQSVKAGERAEFDHSQVWQNVMRGIHPLTPLRGLSNVPTAQIAILTNARGHCQTITTACTSSAQAIGEALRLIQHGVADVMITGGADSMINPYGLVAFSMLGVLSTNNAEWQSASRPFDATRDGFMLGEGAAVIVLEEYEHCRRRGHQPYAELLGYCSTNDAYRLTDEPPEAWGSIDAMRGAISDAGITTDQIDYINAHGTGTRMNDGIESFAIASVFGSAASRIPVSSTKSMIGHLVAAAGAVELTACLVAMQEQTIPPTINYKVPDPKCVLDYCPNAARAAAVDVVLSNSFGFGGQNACLVMKRLKEWE